MQNPWGPGTKREREVKNNAIEPNREHDWQIPMCQEDETGTPVNYKCEYLPVPHMILGEYNL